MFQDIDLDSKDGFEASIFKTKAKASGPPGQSH